MAGQFEALDELLDEFIVLPVPVGEGDNQTRKMYKVVSPSAQDGLKIERLTNFAIQAINGGEDINTEILDDDEERNLYTLLLGATFDDMMKDGVTWAWVRHVSLTALMWVSSGVEVAEQFWKAAGDPERMAPNRETRRSKQQGGSAAAKSTPQRGYTNGTNQNRGTSGHRRRGTQKSRGGNSSKSGT